MNDVDGARQQDTAGSYIPVTLGEEYNNSPYKNDISEEELISIEDTYRETAGAGLIGSYNEYKESKNNDYDSGSQPYGTKSMTIIQEDEGEYEESQFIMSNNPKNSLLRSKADLLSKSNCQTNPLSQRDHQKSLVMRESYETFGGMTYGDQR